MVATTDLSKQENRNSGFEIKQETVAVTVFSKAGRGFLKKKMINAWKELEAYKCFYKNNKWMFSLMNGLNKRGSIHLMDIILYFNSEPVLL